MNNFIVMEIGCLECGVPTSLVGRFKSFEKAKEFADRMNDENRNKVEAPWKKA